MAAQDTTAWMRTAVQEAVEAGAYTPLATLTEETPFEKLQKDYIRWQVQKREEENKELKAAHDMARLVLLALGSNTFMEQGSRIAAIDLLIEGMEMEAKIKGGCGEDPHPNAEKLEAWLREAKRLAECGASLGLDPPLLVP